MLSLGGPTLKKELVRLLLVKCNDNKMVKSSYNCHLPVDEASDGQPTKKGQKCMKTPHPGLRFPLYFEK